ncbi:MAG: ABC transporter ATP-binding protein, partial [Methanomicrobia archaeon]|nr:ABC transporter ATP-binding protein [Methanomicrobia archaeon]
DLTSNPGTIHIMWPALLRDFGIIMGFYVVSALLNWIADFIIVKISANYAFRLRKEFKEKLDLLPLSFFDRQTYGEILSRGTNDVDTISRSMQQIILQIISGITMFIGVLIAMFVTSWELALVAIAILPLSIIFTAGIAIFSQKEFKTYHTKLGKLESLVEENFGGYKVIKLFNRQEDQTKRFIEINEIMQKADHKAQFFSGFIFPTLRFVNNVGFVGVCVVGGLLNDLGSIIAFLMFLQMFQQPFQQVGQISNIIQSTVAAAERIFAVLDEKEMEKETENAIDTEDNIQGEIVFNHVSFSYNEEQKLIEDMNLHVHPGDSIAIVGPTGAGKTTIVNLIMRFYEIQAGSISLDGTNIRDYTRSALRGSVGMVLQDTWLFNGSIRNNIRYGRTDATDEEIEQAAVAAHADHFIKTLPGGYDFVLNEDGSNISQGQRQLLTIARAILSQPKILILDEATSSVDTRTELAIQNAMNQLMVGRTSFVIAHRLSTIKKAKMIIVMNKGQIIETGNHETLLAKNGFYADLYNAQFLGSNVAATNEA